VFGVDERFDEQFVRHFLKESVNALQSDGTQFLTFLVAQLGEQIEKQSLINKVYVVAEGGTFEEQAQSFDGCHFEGLMQILQKVVEEHHSRLLNVGGEVWQSSHFRPKVRESSAMVCRIGGAQQPQILFFDLAVPIFEKVVRHILMKAVQPMYIKVCEFVLQRLHFVQNCLLIILSICVL
jgi:hypothetical protein